MKGSAELEMVAKWIVLLVVLAIAIELIFMIYDHSRMYLGDSSNDRFNSTLVELKTVSQSQMKIYVRSCWEKVRDIKDEDFTCYILEGNFSAIDQANLTESGQEFKLDSSGFDPKKDAAVIKYDRITKKIILRN